MITTSRVKKRVAASEQRRQSRTLGTRRMGNNNGGSKIPETSRISLWDVNSDSEKAPIARGTIQLVGTVLDEILELIEAGEECVTLGVAIWQNNSDSDNAPTFRGSVQSPSEREAAIATAKAKSKRRNDDDEDEPQPKRKSRTTRRK